MKNYFNCKVKIKARVKKDKIAKKDKMISIKFKNKMYQLNNSKIKIRFTKINNKSKKMII